MSRKPIFISKFSNKISFIRFVFKNNFIFIFMNYPKKRELLPKSFNLEPSFSNMHGKLDMLIIVL